MMDNLAGKPQTLSGRNEPAQEAVADLSQADPDIRDGTVEARAAPRFTPLIRAAKLVSSHGEFVCVLRDVSDTGLCAKLFHRAPTGEPIELHMPGGGVYELRTVWERGNEVGYEFTRPVDIARLINEASQHPKRGLRIGVYFPIRLRTLSGRGEGVVENLSQQGARFVSEDLYAIDQSLFIDSAESGVEFTDVRAKVRWRRESEYGVVFDDTLSLAEFARLAARLQCPLLLD